MMIRGKEKWDTVSLFFQTLVVPVGEELETCKKIIRDSLSFPESEVDACIFSDMKKKFNFGTVEVRNLNKYHKEERKKGNIEEEITDLDEIDVSAEMRENATRKARKIMESGNPIEFIAGVVRQYHIGDDNTEEGLCVSIASQSCLNSAGIQVALNGESGSGKSHIVKTHLRLVPAKYRVSSGLSPKAAYYMHLKEGMIVFSDDVNMSLEMEEIIKRSTTNYQEYTEYNTVFNGEGRKLTIPPRINWFLTSVNSESSKEVLNRQLTFSTIESQGHKDTIFVKQQECAEYGICDMTDITEDIVVCRTIYEMIKSQTFKVRIPFVKQIDIKDKSDSRIFPLFLDMIKGYTVFFYKQRQLEDGFLIATKDDFDKAKKLFTSQLNNIVSKLNDKEIKILQFIYDKIVCDINDIVLGTKLSHTTVRYAIKGRPDRHNTGLLSKVEGLTVEKYTEVIEKCSKSSEKFCMHGDSKWDLWPDFIVWKGDSIT